MLAIGRLAGGDHEDADDDEVDDVGRRVDAVSQEGRAVTGMPTRVFIAAKRTLAARLRLMTSRFVRSCEAATIAASAEQAGRTDGDQRA